MNTKEIVRLYTEQNWTLRRIANRLHTDHHRVKRILEGHGIEIVRKPNPPYTAEHRRKIGKASKGRASWCKGLQMPESFKRNNMKAKLKTDIDLDQYPDYGKLSFLTHLLTKRRIHLCPTDAARRTFLDKFYFDKDFNAVYDLWLNHNKDRWFYPSLDHISPQSNGGTWELSNLRFVTWFENRAKADMSLGEWLVFREKTHTHSDLFIESIL